MNILQKFSIRKYLSDYSRKKMAVLYVILSVTLIVSFFAAIMLGAAELNFKNFFLSLFNSDLQSTDYKIIVYVRLPRAAAAIFAGAALAVSGVIIQAVLNNVMASPNIIGVNAGAGLFTVISISLAPAAIYLVPIAAFTGALFTGLLICFIARKTGAGRITITLVGITVSSIFTAGISMVKTLFPESIYNMSAFSVGGLSGVDYSVLKLACAGIILSLILAAIFSGYIDVLSLGEETARVLGMNVKLIRFVLLIIASILAGCAVSFAGLLGFVGLVVPHIVRYFTGNRHSVLIPVSALCGSEFVLLCDTLCRVLFRPYEIPVGIPLSFAGGLFFIGIILSKRKSKLYD